MINNLSVNRQYLSMLSLFVWQPRIVPVLSGDNLVSLGNMMTRPWKPVPMNLESSGMIVFYTFFDIFSVIVSYILIQFSFTPFVLYLSALLIAEEKQMRVQ